MKTNISNKELELLAKKIRRLSLVISHNARSSHSGGALSMVDLLAVLYGNFLNISPDNLNCDSRDRFILSKGHCCASLYSALAIKGFIDIESLKENYGKEDSVYFTHATHHLPGVEISTGSLGHGFSVAIGMAIAARTKQESYRTICLCGDGEMQEGSVWEGIMLASQLKLNKLCLIIDYNGIQAMGNTDDIISLEPLKKRLESFNLNVIEIDGHDLNQIQSAFNQFENEKSKPTAIIAHTIKGKGISFMENQLAWHYKSLDDIMLDKALTELT